MKARIHNVSGLFLDHYCGCETRRVDVTQSCGREEDVSIYIRGYIGVGLYLYTYIDRCSCVCMCRHT